MITFKAIDNNYYINKTKKIHINNAKNYNYNDNHVIITNIRINVSSHVSLPSLPHVAGAGQSSPPDAAHHQCAAFGEIS